uniref:Uncharacterized protein n=1 Tax=Nothobranchius kadleci TaxID=1051664 RepID=A0A1A8BJM8_NOTKA
MLKQDWNPDQDKEQEQDPELDSGPCESVQENQLSQTDCLWPPVKHPKTPPPVPLADPSASALRSLLTGLQQQIIRQREEYEARLRHWYQVVQAKIVESERARAAAELRNATLQKEMEQFFDTFGELNNEAKKTEYIVKSF